MDSERGALSLLASYLSRPRGAGGGSHRGHRTAHVGSKPPLLDTAPRSWNASLLVGELCLDDDRARSTAGNPTPSPTSSIWVPTSQRCPPSCSASAPACVRPTFRGGAGRFGIRSSPGGLGLRASDPHAAERGRFACDLDQHRLSVARRHRADALGRRRLRRPRAPLPLPIVVIALDFGSGAVTDTYYTHTAVTGTRTGGS